MSDPGEVTRLLAAARAGEPGAVDDLYPLVYQELRRVAHGQLRRGGGLVTLNTTAMVHEAYLRLVDKSPAEWNDRGHFLAVAAKAMRYILVDAARERTAQKRGGGVAQTLLDEERMGGGGVSAKAEELLALDEALGSLGEMNERLARLVELRFFAGLTVEETAEALGVSGRTVKRDWRVARAFLFQALGGGEAGAG